MRSQWWHWNSPGLETSAEDEQSAPVLVSLHFVRTALRRSRRVWIGLTVVGVAAGLAWSVLLAPPSQARVALLLVHDPGANPDVAMATDVSLLGTRLVAQRVIDDLELDMTPEEVQGSVVAVPVTSSVLEVTVDGSDDATATAIARALAESFLDFRNDRVQAHSTALIESYEAQTSRLRTSIATLGERAAAGSRAGDEDQATELLTRRAALQSQLDQMSRTMQDIRLRSESVVAATQVLDPAHALPASTTRRFGLGVLSGLVGGMAAGMGLVLLLAISSDRVRRREDVAKVLGMPVGISVGPLRWRPSSLLLSGRSRPGRNLPLVVTALEAAIFPREDRPERIAFASVDNVRDVTRVVAALGIRLADLGHRVCLVDISEAGLLERTVQRAARHSGTTTPTVIRPEGVSQMARGPVGTGPGLHTALPRDHPRREAWDTAEVTLTLTEIDPALGAANLFTWARRVVVVVSAGRSTVERLATTDRMMQLAGQRADSVVLLDADGFDQSLGEPGEGEDRRAAPREAVPS